MSDCAAKRNAQQLQRFDVAPDGGHQSTGALRLIPRDRPRSLAQRGDEPGDAEHHARDLVTSRPGHCPYFNREAIESRGAVAAASGIRLPVIAGHPRSA